MLLTYEEIPVKYTTLILLSLLTLSGMMCCASGPASMSNLIGEAFIKGANKKLRNGHYTSDKKGKDLLHYVIGLSHSLKIEHKDIEMTIKKEDSGTTEKFIIRTIVHGTVKDFEYTNVIKNERDLLKFKLIKSYRDKSTSGNLLPGIDTQTKTAIAPDFVIVTDPHILFRGKVSTTRKAMVLDTYFSPKEFDALLDAHFDSTICGKKSQVTIEKTETSRFSTSGSVLLTGMILGGALVWAYYYQKSFDGRDRNTTSKVKATRA